METANEKLSDEKSETYKVSKVSMETGKSQAFEYTYQRGLPPTVSDKLIDRIVQKLPDWLSGIFMNRERSVLLVERKIQRKFLSEYRAQIKSLDPLLRERGRILGKSVIQAFAGHHAARFNYNDIESQSREMLFFQQQNVQEVIRTLDPLIQPVLSPFVEGIKSPIDEAVSSVQQDVYKALIATAAFSFGTGLLVGTMISWKQKRR